MAVDKNGNELRPGVTYQKGTRKRTFLGYSLWFIVYRNSRGTVADAHAEKWFKQAVPVKDGDS
ncbi:hypothetical protein GCM10025857_40090 [Alicyclobacillus contaminans]|nr:hypothetical protein GCM10025857_39500 [Alicyclobacillus contaminans]GMA52652.1 hypothetical protein GCM10025857_40090 [Alicyclobacillus contaminans]